MTAADKSVSWLPAIDKQGGPLYLAIADALEADIVAGRLSQGFRLPPQRSLARELGIDFTTVTRAYGEARRRRLVEGFAGQGTFVRAPAALLPPQSSPQNAPVPDPATADGVDLSMNLPPLFRQDGLNARLRQGFATAWEVHGLSLLLRYQEPGGTGADRATGARWLSARLPQVSREQVLVCPGAQGAFAVILALLAEPGDTIATEALTYPGFRSLASHQRLRLRPVAMDRHGLRPDAFRALCLEQRPKALYCTPTLHNPTTATLPLERRQELVALARAFAVPIIEDDAYGAIPAAPLPPLAALAPEQVFHVATLSKCLAPALRIAYLVVPEARHLPRLTAGIRALTSMASPLTATLARTWIDNGTAAEVLREIRAEAVARQAIARDLLPPEQVTSDPEGFHLWLRLPARWSRGEFAERLRAAGIGTVQSDAFAVAEAPECVRLGLGAAAGREELRQGLELIRDLLAAEPSLSSLVI